ncbi:hypothetical protein ATI61_109207 [Archangium gephyra]|uniref:Small molecule metabolism n=1 Tax=Archangium gephyra TaxID=48 RepID=A0AAC8Q2I0_9BACT|nr:hypothetical protein [Archangium gephyra]AKI99601.1 small molecule metabolism [Archangium gephyra]REG27866.1 hypothetical protein ATI61_109207 [Archangium gephyra]
MSKIAVLARFVRVLAVCAALLPVAGLAGGVAMPNGSPEKATEYYKKMSKTLGIRTPDTILGTHLGEVLEWLGYRGLTITDLETLSPEVLMNLGAPVCGDTKQPGPIRLSMLLEQGPLRPGDILVSRFFAPKITNIAEAAESRGVGWRKLIRFKARKGSEAEKHLIESATLLFNYVTKPNEAPFAPNARSFNSQLALVSSGYPRKDASCKGEDCRPLLDSIYWMDFGDSREGAKLSLQLDASFDARGLQPLQAGKPVGIVSYYVPDGCDSCHGDPPPRLGKSVLNELDTDHWFDRVAPTDDFPQLARQGIPVLTDAGNDPNSVQFARAFDVIRQLNEEYAQQQARVAPKSYHEAATTTWLRVHEKTPHHRPPIERTIVPSLQGPGPGLQWSRDSKEDVELLGMLNRYCFRCHGTIRFSVFNKTEVARRKLDIRMRLKPKPVQAEVEGFQMPPDRDLPAADLERLVTLINNLPRVQE